MRLADTLLRRGHLSERSLAEVWMTGERPLHLDQCDHCATRAVEMGRWLDDVRAIGLAEADAVFPPERLAAQQAQILRRLEQADQPVRVIEFPGQIRAPRVESVGRRVRPAWVAVAAAAGLVIGVVSGQVSARLTQPAAPTAHATPAEPPIEAGPVTAGLTISDPSLLEEEITRGRLKSVSAMEDFIPQVVAFNGSRR